MSDFVQKVVEPTSPTTLEIPNFSEFSDLQLMDFANTICGMYLQHTNRQEIRAVLKAECLLRIRRLILKPTQDESIAGFDLNAQLLLALTQAYAIAVTGVFLKLQSTYGKIMN